MCVCVYVCVCTCCGRKIYEHLKNIFSFMSTLKKRDKFKFSFLAVLFKNFFIKIRLNMSDQEKKNLQRIYDLLNAGTKPKHFRNMWRF